MTPTLRKWHRFIWPLLSILLLMGIVAAIKVSNQSKSQSKVSDRMKINLQNGALEVHFSEVPAVPSCLLYFSNNDKASVEGDRLLGLGKKGVNRFNVDSIQVGATPVLKGFDKVGGNVIFIESIQVK